MTDDFLFEAAPSRDARVLYVPILKGREGEFGALEALTSAERDPILPLIEVPPVPWDFEAERPTKQLRAHVATLPQRIFKAWGGRPAMLDFGYLAGQEAFEDGVLAASYVLNQCTTFGVRIAPVLTRQSSPAYLTAAGDHARDGGVGVCVRVYVADFDDDVDLEAEVDRLLRAVSVDVENATLLVDLRDLRNETARALLEARGVLNMVPHAARWRRVGLAASSFPSDLSDVDAAASTLLPRREWELWRALLARRDRVPTMSLVYADYTIAHPDPKELDPRTMRMSASIRYTTADHWLVIKGRNVRQFGYDQYFDLSKAVVTHASYSGKDFSWGDDYLYACAQAMTGPGNATTWRKVGTNHHLVFVARQLTELARTARA